ncbi:hypothetical protein [Sphingomonas colocasiae]|nr:hypothetical protein [Sphingomonas colocasiae]
MTVETHIAARSSGIVAALVHGLETEFGRGAGEALARRFLDAEEVDFCWDARVRERWLGAFEGAELDGIELDRVAVLGVLDRRWFVAGIIVDGEGQAQGMIARRAFGGRRAAERAFANAR